jgi:hypothetical protein
MPYGSVIILSQAESIMSFDFLRSAEPLVAESGRITKMARQLLTRNSLPYQFKEHRNGHQCK